MTDLAALLAGDVAPGVHRWQRSSDETEVRALVERAGWRFASLVTSDGGRSEALEALGQALDLPPWWGRNLDALADCLADLDTSRTLLLWDGWGALVAADPRAFDVVRRLLDAAGQAVLLRGDGPEVDVPVLG